MKLFKNTQLQGGIKFTTEAYLQVRRREEI